MDDGSYTQNLMGTDTESMVDSTIKYESEKHHQFFHGSCNVCSDSNDNDSGAPIAGADSRKAVKAYRSSGNLNRTTRISPETISAMLVIKRADGNTGSRKSVGNALEAPDLVSPKKVTSQSQEPLYRSGSNVSFQEGAVNPGYHSSESGVGVQKCSKCMKCLQILDGSNYDMQMAQRQPVCNHCMSRERPPVGGGGAGARPKRVTCIVCKQATDLKNSRRVESGTCMYICLSCHQK